MKNSFLIIMAFCCMSLYGQQFAFLDTNDISAKIYSDGRLFDGHFEVPKGSGMHTIDKLGIWVGGYDEASNLHLAIQTYDSATTDFYFGPIALNYEDSEYISRYNNVWKVNQTTIDYHRSNRRKPGYILPESIANWPGNGNIANGEAITLAPYVDDNLNDIYDPENGDYPIIRGDQAVFFMMNDDKKIKPHTFADKLRMEIHGMAYSFASPPDSAIHQTVFLFLQFINRTSQNLSNVNIGLLSDMNIGYKEDDFLGSDSKDELTYTYNATSQDSIFGTNPPVQGFKINYYDAVFRWDATAGLINFNRNKNNEPLGTGPPETALEYFRYLYGFWRDGTPLTKGGLGYNPGNTDTVRYSFDGDPLAPINKGWTEIEAGNIPGDRKGLNIIGPFDLYPGGDICVEVAFPYARDYTGNNLSSIALLRQRIDSFDKFLYRNDVQVSCYGSPTKIVETATERNSILIYPNPSNGIFQIAKNHFENDKNYKLEIFNTYGQQVYKSSIQQQANRIIDISSQPPGFYFLKLYDGKEFYSAKIIIE
jgi:hypothetical protein